MYSKKLCWHKNNIFHFDTLDSTNNKAFELITAGQKTPFIITTDEQTKGRGRNQNVWKSEKGKNLLCSIVLFPDFLSPTNQFSLLQIISLGLVAALQTILHQVTIKCPNDILVNDKKIAGVLIESSVQGKLLSNVVCGIGLNINQQSFDFSEISATSIYRETGKNFSVDKILEEVLQQVKKYYNKFLIKKSFKEIDGLYQSNLYLFNEKANFKIGERVIAGRIIGVDKFGRLGIEDLANRITYYGIDEVTYV